ncbi:hypothetical protein [Ligilactobacillus acidipiscis]|uniref:hypothetical protein n=1 Tax=Ligilactobacillus acidipiscis TaxID=89059 RepID=UPI0023F813AF|nr:hypothetical protein [Ligilactobacillus acidipiscis]WEV57433.1 hypothetical protein OZX66_02495 [Ligilactobacillus acidipiscis]
MLEMREELYQLKSSIYGKQMEELLLDEMNQSDENIKKHLLASNGRFKPVYVQVHVKGIKATDYYKWQSKAMAQVMIGTPKKRKELLLSTVLPTHPEHYMLRFSGIVPGLVETLGGLPTNACVAVFGKTPQFVRDVRDETYPNRSFPTVMLQDKTKWSYGLTEYRDTAEGGDFKLRVWWPEACPDLYFEDHTRHFAVEYRNFIRLAYDALQGTDKILGDLEITYDTMFGEVDEQQVDQWEIKAATRALNNLRSLMKEHNLKI